MSAGQDSVPPDSSPSPLLTQAMRCSRGERERSPEVRAIAGEFDVGRWRDRRRSIRSRRSADALSCSSSHAVGSSSPSLASSPAATPYNGCPPGEFSQPPCKRRHSAYEEAVSLPARLALEPASCRLRPRSPTSKSQDQSLPPLTSVFDDEPTQTTTQSSSHSTRVKQQGNPTPVGANGSDFEKGGVVSGPVLLALYTLGLLFSSVGNSLYFKKMTDSMPNYSFFLSQITSATYVPVFGVVVCVGIYNGRVSRESRDFPKQRFALMGLLDASAGILMLVGGAFTAGSTQVVLQQVMIPVALVMSRVILRIRYNSLQTLGATVIILGVIVFKLPDLVAKGTRSGPSDVVAFNVLFVLACVPLGLSQVYKEVAFRDVEMDVNYMQLWVAMFQTLIGFTLAPVNSLPVLGPQRVPLRRIPYILLNGSKCLFLARNTIIENCGLPDQVRCDTCAIAWVPVIAYLSFNVLYNVFTLLVVKHGSATLSFLVATLRLPLSSFAFYSHKIMGIYAQTPKPSDFIGLGVLLAGLICYRVGSARRKKTVEEAAEEAQTRQMYCFATILGTEPSFLRVHTTRSPDDIRSHYYWKLRVASPHESPTFRLVPSSPNLLRSLAQPLLPASDSDSDVESRASMPPYPKATTSPPNSALIAPLRPPEEFSL